MVLHLKVLGIDLDGLLNTGGVEGDAGLFTVGLDHQ